MFKSQNITTIKDYFSCFSQQIKMRIQDNIFIEFVILFFCNFDHVVRDLLRNIFFCYSLNVVAAKAKAKKNVPSSYLSLCLIHAHQTQQKQDGPTKKISAEIG
jgi:hypothetical protein